MLRFVVLIAVLLVSMGSVRAGVVFEIETIDHQQQDSQPQTTRVAVEGRRLSIGIAPGEKNRRGGVMQFRGDRREMVLVDHDSQSYFLMDAQTLRQLGNQLDSALSHMQGQAQQALQGMSAEQRALVEGMMKDRMPVQEPARKPQTTVRRLDQSAEVYGYPCQLYEVRRDGRKIRDLWVTDWSNIQGGSELAPVFADMGQFHQEMMDAMPRMGGQSGGMGDSPYSTMKEINGLPVASRDYADDGSVESETALRSARLQQLDPSTFEPPSGYKRQEMFGGNRSSGPPSNFGERYPQSPR